MEGGLLAVGGADEDDHDAPDELFDEASGRWLALPHPMAQPRRFACVVSMPASALMAPLAVGEPADVGAAT